MVHFLLLLIHLLSGAVAAFPQENSSDAANLDGVWIEQVRRNGTVTFDPPLELQIRGQEWTIVRKSFNGPRSRESFQARIDASKSPQQVDLVSSRDGSAILGVYQLAGNELMICQSSVQGIAGIRPVELKNDAQKRFLLKTYRRKEPNEDLQGRWELVSTINSEAPPGAKRTIREIQGNEDRISWYDEKGNLIRTRQARVQIPEGGMAPSYRFDQVFQLAEGRKWKRSTSGSVQYRVENGVLYEAEGFFVDSKSRDVRPTFSQWRKTSPIDPASWTSSAKSLEGWGTWIDPVGDCRSSLEGANLSITAAGGNHGLWPRNVFHFNLHAPRALQEVRGDFSYELTIPPCEVPASDVEEFKSKGGIVSGSLLLWQDSENFVRLDRYFDPRASRSFVELLVYRHGCMHYSRAWPISEKLPIQFRVVRKEGKFTHFEFREPNQEWQKIPMGTEGGPLFVANELQSQLYVGPAVVSTATSEVTIQFSDRKLEGGSEK